ncbi:MAG: ferritin-like domain-containing protein [Syntrophomonas sp.]
MPNQRLLDLILEAMGDEKHDAEKYLRMMGMTSSEQIREQIKFAYDDEGRHYEMFQQLYYDLTGEMKDVPTPPVKMAKTLLGNVKTSINGELAAVEMYGEIYSLLDDKAQRDMVLSIIQDEQEHATRFVYVYAMLRK